MIGYVPSKTMVAKVDMHVIHLKKDYMCEKTMVAKVDLHVIQLKKNYMCAKTMVAKVDMIIKSFDRICTFKNDGGEG